MIHPHLLDALRIAAAGLPGQPEVPPDDGEHLGLLVSLALHSARRIDDLETKVAQLTGQGVTDRADTSTVIDWLEEMQDRMNGPLPSVVEAL